MGDVAKAVMAYLAELFPEAKTSYQYADTLHKFRMDYERYVQWLILDDAQISDQGVKVIDRLEELGLKETLDSADRRIRLVLTSGGFREESIPD